MATVEERLAALEAQVAVLRGGVGSTRSPAAQDAAAQDVFWALEGVRSRAPEGAGQVLYTGVVRLGDERYEWQWGADVEELLASDWAELAGTLTALAHPVRLQLLREILGGRRSTAELAGIEGLGTSGQLYHHLRQLTAAGWLRTAGRGRYVIPPERVVALLVALTTARR